MGHSLCRSEHLHTFVDVDFPRGSLPGNASPRDSWKDTGAATTTRRPPQRPPRPLTHSPPPAARPATPTAGNRRAAQGNDQFSQFIPRPPEAREGTCALLGVPEEHPESCRRGAGRRGLAGRSGERPPGGADSPGAATPTAAAVTPTCRQRLVAAGGREEINFELGRGGRELHGCRCPSGLARSPPHAVGRPLTEEPPRRFLRRRPWCVWGAGFSPAPESGASPPPSGLLPPSCLRPRPPPPASLLRRCRPEPLGIGFSPRCSLPDMEPSAGSRREWAPLCDPPAGRPFGARARSDGAGRDAACRPEDHGAYAEESSQEAGDAAAAAGLHLRHPLLRLVHVQPALQTGWVAVAAGPGDPGRAGRAAGAARGSRGLAGPSDRGCSRFESPRGNTPAGGRGGGAARVPQEKAPRRAGARPQPRGQEAAASLAPGGQGLPSTVPAREASRRQLGGLHSGIEGQSRGSCVPGNVPGVVSLLPVQQSWILSRRLWSPLQLRTTFHFRL